MKYMVGYQLRPDGAFSEAILRYRAHISEVYFSWGDIPNGRSLFSANTTCQSFEAQQRQVEDLRRFSRAGIGLNLLLNANCYGKDSQSRLFFDKIGNAVEYLSSPFNLVSATVTSPLLAKFIRTNFPTLEIRASVNMEIGTAQGMDYVAGYYDGYYMKRELNRKVSSIRELRRWCDQNGKKLYLLANSGCLNHCSVHNFHDNLVAHEHEIQAMDNAYDFKGLCHDYLRRREKQASIIRDSNYVRPEDLHLYEGYFDGVKLATRINRNPVAVLVAYVKGHHSGNIMELLEPNHAESFYPVILENRNFPENFAATVMNCAKDCEHCHYCANVFERIKVKLNQGEDILC